ncbi:hypothetical protein SAMN05216338_107923 [Bradyrhizobium sp. Rc2d]|uniref:hypothetical protein n=1 Tax=Bradyrhizobium sp. Rc2d TaxID=1855321 RepID=UPI0008883333|nr:hypothetical protein [Bradyrhizobium sp. Rc2d]SDK00566.1 hypothetical protein SAMN05216338_107923 [Bradyrhizobium sp. Rc2d]
MTTENVIKIDDARELRALGLPILPVIDKDFSKAADKLFVDAARAKAQFYLAFRDYCKAASPTKQRFNRMRRALEKLASISDRAAEFTSSDECEAEALQMLLTKPMISFVEYWDATLAVVEEGEPVTINLTQEMLEGWSVPL